MKLPLSKIILLIAFFIAPALSFAQTNTIGDSTGITGANQPIDFTNGAPTGGLFSGNTVTADPQSFNNTPGGTPVAGDSYQPITPQFRQIFGGFGDSFEGMIQSLFEKILYFTVILSVIMIIVGGVEYMGSESVFKKSDGKGRIFAAIGGLLIALISILVISTILPGGSGNAFRINIFNEQ